MRLFLGIVLFASLACATGKSDDDDDGGGLGDSIEGNDPGDCSDGLDNDDDGFADCEDGACASGGDCGGDADTDADADSDTDSDSDTDTDADSDSDVTYDGDVEATYTYDGTTYDCIGTFTLTISRGNGSGEASCMIEELDGEISGDLEGEAAGSDYEGLWIIVSGEIEFPMSGRATSSSFNAEFVYESDVEYIEGTFSGRP